MGNHGREYYLQYRQPKQMVEGIVQAIEYVSGN